MPVKQVVADAPTWGHVLLAEQNSLGACFSSEDAAPAAFVGRPDQSKARRPVSQQSPPQPDRARIERAPR